MMTKNPPAVIHPPACARPSIEALEPRTFLSSSPGPSDLFVHPIHFSSRPRDSSPAGDGYTPAQIRSAYGFDSVSFGNGTVAGDGAGQTIAIVDAYNDQALIPDLAAFDGQFGIAAPPELQIVNQTGGTRLPRASRSWASEIALDVEWAHAIAPGADILLVETNSESTSNLLAGVAYARTVPAVSVVSMSWGGSEFYTFNGKQYTGEVDDDAYFTTPPGHQGETFVTAAGDNGAAAGAGWPGDSPNVLTVGGTSLLLSGQTGAISSETTWDQTGGGFSQVEPEPAYQLDAQQSGARGTPDVAYDADPNNGFVMYDSLPYQGFVDFQETGGDSAGTPQWAALVAIADQGRVLAGEGTLDGPGQTLPALYDLYSPPGTPGYSTYLNYFNDIIDTTAGGQPSTGLASTIGYDTATGLGTPKAAAIIGALVATTLTASIPPAAGSSAAAPLDVAFIAPPAGAAVGGTRSTVELRLSDAQAAPFAAPGVVTLYASPGPTLDSSASELIVQPVPKLRVRVGKPQTVKLKFSYPAALDGASYFLIASVSAAGTSSDVAGTSTVTVSAPAAELSAAFTDLAVSVDPGQPDAASVTVQDLGDLPATGPVSVDLYASATSVLNASATLLTSRPARGLGLSPGKDKQIVLDFIAPAGLTPGTYFLLASVASTQPPAGAMSDEIAVVGTLAPE
jgi:hypothetical protein